ncbi:MAG: hypothetical protein ACFFCP_14935 [Promethearchaeota archaeon]
MVILGSILLLFGYIGNSEDMKQWGVIGVLTGFVLVLAGREITRGKILGPNEEEEAFEIQTKIFQNAMGFVKVVDTFPGPNSLKALSETPKGTPIQFLALDQMSRKNVKEFERLANELCLEREEVEVRYMPKDSFHDRFILTKPFGWHLGSSMKDLGRKITRIGPMGVEETEKVIIQFDYFWPLSRPLEDSESS